MQRGYLYLCVAAAAAVILICWPSSTDEPTAAATDSLPAPETHMQPQKLPIATSRTQRQGKQKKHDVTQPVSPRLGQTPAQEPSLNDSATAKWVSPVRRKPLQVELNGADTLTLQLLHGIGPAYAKRIVNYRERIGGFVNKEQLMEVYGLTPQLLDHIAPFLTIDTSLMKRIKINEVSLKELIRNPYIDYYQARDLIDYRNKGHRFTSPEELMLISSMDDTTRMRLLPYLDFQ